MGRALCHDNSLIGRWYIFLCTGLRRNLLAVSCSEEVQHLTACTVRSGTETLHDSRWDA